jgi:SPP1 family predicted phage head-tail adaptor
MRAGKLDRRIRIERMLVGPRSASGQPQKTPTLQAEVWAELVENRGQEGFASNAVAAKAELRFRIRYPGDLSPLPSPSEDCRVVYGGRAYDVISTAEIGRREGMFLFVVGRAEVAA